MYESKFTTDFTQSDGALSSPWVNSGWNGFAGSLTVVSNRVRLAAADVNLSLSVIDEEMPSNQYIEFTIPTFSVSAGVTIYGILMNRRSFFKSMIGLALIPLIGRCGGTPNAPAYAKKTDKKSELTPEQLRLKNLLEANAKAGDFTKHSDFEIEMHEVHIPSRKLDTKWTIVNGQELPQNPRIIDVVRVYYPDQLAKQLCDIQPLTQPTGQIFTIKRSYGWRKYFRWLT